MNSLPNNNFLTIHEAAKILHVTTKTLRRWEVSGKLIAIRTAGGHRRYTQLQIENIKKSKLKPDISTPIASPEINTSKVAEIVQKETQYLKNEISNIKANYDQESYKNLLKYSLPSAAKLLAFYIIGALLLAGIFVGLKNNVAGSGLKFLASKNEKIAQVLGYRKVSSETNADNMRIINPEHVEGNNVLADTTAVAAQTFNVYVETNIGENVNIDRDLEISGGNLTSSATTFNLLNQTVEALNIGGAATLLSVGAAEGITTINNNLEVNGTSNDIAGNLNLSGNSLTSSGDLTINPTGGGVSIGRNTPGNVDMAGNDFFVSGDVEVDGTAYIPTLAINSDTVTDITGNGLQVSSGALETTIGNSVESSEITDGTIQEVDLNISNDPTNGYILTYNDSSGGFSWVSSISDLWTDSGTITYLNSTTDNLAIGGTDSSAAFYLDVSTGDINITNNITAGGQITAGASAITITTLNGYLDADAIQLITSDGVGGISSGSGLETDSDRLGLLQGCTTGQILKWNDGTSTWDCGNDDAGVSGIVNIKENDTTLFTNISTIDFVNVFSVTETPAGEANIDISDNSLNFSELSDSLTMDAATTITNGTSGNLTIDLTSTGDFVISDNSVPYFTFSDTGTLTQAGTGQVTLTGNVDSTNGLDVTGTDLTVGGTNFSVTESSGDITTSGDIAVNGGNITSSGDLTIDPSGGQVNYSDGTVFNIGGLTGVAYNAISNSGTALTATDDNDLFIEGTLEAGQLCFGASCIIDWASAGINYWNRVVGNLSPITVGDTISATSSASTVASFTSTGTNNALRAGGIANAVTIDSSGNLIVAGTTTLSTIGAGATNNVLTLSAGSIVESRSIDSRVWGTSLVDGTGSSNQVAYWSDGNTIAGENYLSSSRGGTGLDASTAGNGMLLIGNGSGLSLGYITGGTGIDIASTSGNITITHADLSAQGSVDNSGTTVIQDVTMDTLGHVTGLSSVDLSSSFDNYQSWSAADDDADTYAIVSSNILRFTSSDSNVLTNLTNGDDSDENMDFSVRLLGDLVSGSGLTGGADNILVGADTDITLSIGAGNGIVVGADSVAIQLLDAADGAGASSNYSGLEFGDTGDNELTLLQGCSDGQILKWNDSSNVWYCAADTSGGVSNYWQIGSEGLAPYNTTLDLYIGGTSTGPATFSVAAATGNIDTSGTITAATDETINGIDINAGAISDVTTLNATSTITFSGIGTGTDDSVVILNGSNQLTTDEIDSRVWGTSLVDGTGSSNQVAYWSDGNTIAGENYLSSSRGGTGLDASTAGNGMLLIGNGSGLSLGYITGGTGIDIASTSGNITITHADLSAQGSVDNSGTTVIQDVTMDTLGHVTGLSSVDLSSSFDNYQSWSAADDDADTYAIVSSNILRFTSSDSNVLTNLTNGDDSDENMDFSVRLLGDLVSGSGLTGGADNILVGADTDITLVHRSRKRYRGWC